MPVVDDVRLVEPSTEPEGVSEPPVGFWRRWFGPLTPVRLVVLLAAVAFLGGAAGYTLRAVEAKGTAADVGFLRDMTYHHSQAVQMAQMALAGDMPDEARMFAQEVVMQQRYEIGLMRASMYRLGGDPEGDGTAMAWMDMPVPIDDMPGMASPEEISALEDAEGAEAAELFFALMSRHHLGGVHMAEEAAERADDPWVRDLASRMARNQRQEVLEYSASRQRQGLGVPDGYPETPVIDVPPERDHGRQTPWLVIAAAGGFVAIVGIGWRVLRRSRVDDAADDPSEVTP